MGFLHVSDVVPIFLWGITYDKCLLKNVFFFENKKPRYQSCESLCPSEQTEFFMFFSMLVSGSLNRW